MVELGKGFPRIENQSYSRGSPLSKKDPEAGKGGLMRVGEEGASEFFLDWGLNYPNLEHPIY